MSNYNNLKFTINNNIKANGNEEITGAILNSVLINMVSSLGAGYQFMGVATPSTNPGVPDQKVFYLAYTSGTYMNFSGLVVSGLCVLKFDTVWTKDDIPVSGSYVLPIATANALGGVKIGTGLSIDPQSGVLSSNGGSSFNGGEITQDLWLHTGGENYGSTLYFGDKNGITGYAYIKEDSDDHLVIYAANGISLLAGNDAGVNIPSLLVALGSLSDVDLSNVADGQALVYRDGEWVNETIQGGTLPIASAQVLGGVKIGTGLSIDPQTGVLTATGGGSYVLPQASANALGGIKIGYVQSGRYYPVELDSNGNAYVYVPWQSGSGGSTVQWGTPSGDKIPLTVDGDTKQLLTAHQSLDDYVTKGTQQTITGEKTFTTNPVHIGSNSGIDVDGSSYIDLGDARLKWDSTNHSLYVTKRPGSSYAGNINLVVDGDVGAGGVGTGASVKYVNCASQSVYDNISPKDPATMYTIGTAPSFTRIYLGSIKIYGN